jgi:DNA-binding response OmpR family regulator
MKVVVIEDNADIANWVCQALSFIGGFDEVKPITTNFPKLIGNGQWDGVDAVLLDWNLPHFDTSTLLDYLAKERPHVRRVVFTAQSSDEIPPDNIDVLLQKPVSMDRIASALMGETHRGEDL